jgi:hypothetical protein
VCGFLALVGVAGATPQPVNATAAGANTTVEDVTVTGFDHPAVTTGTGPVTAGATAATGATPARAAGTAAARTRIQQSCFSADAYEGEAGDLVTVSVGCTGYLLVGGDRQEDATSVTNYVDVWYVTSGTTFTVNTRLLGTDAPSSAVFSNGVSSYAHDLGADSAPSGTFSGLDFETANGTDIATLADLRERMRVSPLDRPLRPKRYRLLMTNGTVVLGEDGIAYADDPVDRSNLKLVRPEIELEQPGTYIAPQGSADRTDELAQLRTVWTERGKVAAGDRLVIGGFGTDGIRGTLDHFAADEQDPITPQRTGPTLLQDLTEAPEGVSLTIEQTNPGPNKDPAKLSLDGASEDGLSLVFGPDREEFYLVVDTRQRSSLFDREFSANATFEVTYTIQSEDGERFEFVDPGPGNAPGPFETKSGTDPGQYPYFGVEERTESVSTEFRLVEPRIEYDRLTRDGEVIVSNTSDAAIPGYTNYAPGSDIEFQLISEDEQPPERIELGAITIRTSGEFRVVADLSVLEREYPIEIEVYLRERLYDRRPVVLAEDPNDPVRFEIVNATGNVTVARGSPLADLTATIRNTGVDVGAQSVTLRAGERLLGNRSLFLADGENTTIDYGSTRANLPVGNYTYVLETGDDEATGEIRVVATPTPTPTTTTTTTTTAPTTTGTPVPTAPTTSAAPTTAPPTTGSPSVTAAPNGTGTPAGSDTGLLGGSFLGLGLVSSRAVVGAAAVVGAVYVVGYWKN